MIYAVAGDIATHLGRPLNSTEEAQVSLWIGWLEADIALRLPPPTLVDDLVAQRVIVQSIAAYMDNPSAASEVQVSVDDGSVTKRYTKSLGRVQILPELWADLGWSGDTGAFTVTPYAAPDVGADVDAWR